MAEQNKRILKDFLNELVEKFNGHRSDISSEDVLEQFMAWAEARGTTLYPAQEEAILELLDGKNVIVLPLPQKSPYKINGETRGEPYLAGS